VAVAVAAGFELVDVNLIFGIPGQDCDSFLAGVDELIGMGVDQISAYPLFTFDHTLAGQPGKEHRYARASQKQRLTMQHGVAQLCRAAGLERTSVWSFTRRGHSPYTTVTRPHYVGFGAGAGSKSAQRAAFNTFSVHAYNAAAPRAIALVHELSPRQSRADWLYWQIYNARIDAPAYVALFGRTIEHDFGRLLKILCACGFLTQQADGYTLTESGAVRVHAIQSVFSLNGIDSVWSQCRRTSWPEAVRVA
jgi:coproporphyrinogen III oxidase-like Fe-S oxidoreductase